MPDTGNHIREFIKQTECLPEGMPVSQSPYIDGQALPRLMKPQTSLPSLITHLPKISQILPSEWDQKSRFPPINKPWILTSVLGIKKPKMAVPPSSPQELEEKRYTVDVEAQRKNLILLNQATKTSGLPLQQHTTARNLIIETLHMNNIRLGYLFRKYIAYRLIQRARQNIIKQLKTIRNNGKGYEMQNLYIMLSRIDDYQKKVMKVWTEKQKSLEEKRSQCLRNMMFLFSQCDQPIFSNLSGDIGKFKVAAFFKRSTNSGPQCLAHVITLNGTTVPKRYEQLSGKQGKIGEVNSPGDPQQRSLLK
ncbi:Protein FAM186A [Sciurus carolinensis]|uniref:Protein FAM186A n=1 Tax=Sciurus carolinensis TaxID=30640 RepID=A0AA41T0T0_SCICA|nr:Protein FAM186A [Sciurus carolinensis]